MYCRTFHNYCLYLNSLFLKIVSKTPLEVRMATISEIVLKYNCFIVDLNECNATGAVCNIQTESCENTEGGYLCNCMPGYRKVDGVCRGKFVHSSNPFKNLEFYFKSMAL